MQTPQPPPLHRPRDHLKTIIESIDGTSPQISKEQIEKGVLVKFHFGLPKGEFENLLKPLRTELFVECYYYPHLAHRNIWLRKRTTHENRTEYSLKKCVDSSNPSKSFVTFTEELDLEKIQTFLKEEELTLNPEDWSYFARIHVQRTYYKFNEFHSPDSFYIEQCKIGEHRYEIGTFSALLESVEDQQRCERILEQLQSLRVKKPVRSKVVQHIHLLWCPNDERRIMSKIVPNDSTIYTDKSMVTRDPYIDNKSTEEDMKEWAQKRGIKSPIKVAGSTILCLPEEKAALLSEANIEENEIDTVMFWLKAEPDWDQLLNKELAEMASWDPESDSQFTPLTPEEMKAVERNIYTELANRIRNRSEHSKD